MWGLSSVPGNSELHYKKRIIIHTVEGRAVIVVVFDELVEPIYAIWTPRPHDLELDGCRILHSSVPLGAGEFVGMRVKSEVVRCEYGETQ